MKNLLKFEKNYMRTFDRFLRQFKFKAMLFAEQKSTHSIFFRHIQQYLSNILHNMAQRENLDSVAFLTKDLHVWPDFHGNRSPIADPSLKGMVRFQNVMDNTLEISV